MPPKQSKGNVENKLYITRSIPVGAVVTCADNSGARTLKIAQVAKWKGRFSRLPAASVGDKVSVVVGKGKPELQKQIFPAVIVRQKYPIRRASGVRVSFEDNAAVLTNQQAETKGSGIKGPVAREAAERWPRIAALASAIV